MFVGPISDFGWTYSHNFGRLHLGTVLRDEVTTEYAEEVHEDLPTATKVGQDFVDRGFKLIFFTSFGYMDAALELARVRTSKC